MTGTDRSRGVGPTSVPDPTLRRRVVHKLVGRPAALQFRILELALRAQFRLGTIGMVPDTLLARRLDRAPDVAKQTTSGNYSPRERAESRG